MKIRIISAIVALIIVVPLVLLGGIYFRIGVLLLASLAYKELVDLKQTSIPLLMKSIGLISLLLILLSDNYSSQILALILLFLIIPIVFYKDNYKSVDALYLVGVITFISFAFNSFYVIRTRSLSLFVFLIIIPMINDIFAYFIGSRFGKNKLCPEVSPNKTWEGSIGGLVIGSVVGLVIYYFLIGHISLKMFILTIILSISGQVGDLVLSKIKRENKIKDFSNIMPGHGGILDRCDSIIFVFITYMFLSGF